jgi:hypothetical protein
MAFVHASYSGYFPFCITQGGSVGDNTEHPIGMSLEDAMALFWKPKTFRIVESWDTVWLASEDPYIVYTVTGETNVTLSSGKTKMSESVCPPFDTIITGNAGTFTRTRPPATPSVDFVTDILNLQLFADEPYVILQGGLYYPRMVFSRASNPDYWEWSSIGGGGTTSEFYRAEISINDNTYSFQMYSIAAELAVSTNCSSVITIDEERDTE